MRNDTRSAGPALVIGGSGAIGASLVTRLAARGYTVTATYHHTPPPTGSPATWVRCDAADERSVACLADVVPAGDGPLRVLAYLAGAASSKLPVAGTTPAEYRRLFEINALGLALVWQVVAASARRGGAGVVALSSDTTRVVGAGNGAYSAAKAALEAMAVTMAREEARHGVRVNVVAPSLVDSPLAGTVLARKGVTDLAAYYAGLPWARPLSVAEVAEVTASVATDPHWRYATGQVIRLAAGAATG